MLAPGCENNLKRARKDSISELFLTVTDPSDGWVGRKVRSLVMAALDLCRLFGPVVRDSLHRQYSRFFSCRVADLQVAGDELIKQNRKLALPTYLLHGRASTVALQPEVSLV